MYITCQFKGQLSLNWHLNLTKVCATQSWWPIYWIKNENFKHCKKKKKIELVKFHIYLIHVHIFVSIEEIQDYYLHTCVGARLSPLAIARCLATLPLIFPFPSDDPDLSFITWLVSPSCDNKQLINSFILKLKTWSMHNILVPLSYTVNSVQADLWINWNLV